MPRLSSVDTDSTDYHHPDTNVNALKGWCFNAHTEFSQDDVIDATTGKDKVIPNLVHPTGDTEGRLCMYQCVTWKTFNLQTIVTSTGSIAVGATIVVVMTEWVSTMLGKPLIEQSTSPKDLQKLVQSLRPDGIARRFTKPIQASMFCSAIPVVAVYALLKWYLVTKLDSDGFYTVDYYTTFVILFSVSLVTLLRTWHPFQCRPQLFTKKIWSQGSDHFVISALWFENWNREYPGSKSGEFKKMKDVGDDLVLVKVDLYQWMQLRAKERIEVLINYCRRPSPGDQEKGSEVVPIAAVAVKLLHDTEKTEKTHMLAVGQTLTIKKWKNDEEIFVMAEINGKMEEVVVPRNEVLEKSQEWTDVLSELEKDLMDRYGETGNWATSTSEVALESGGKPLLNANQI